jgi:hypothetical protein
LNAHPQGISLLFNTFIAQREAVHRSITLTPPIKTEYSWFGKTLFIAFKEPLDSNTTVAMTLGTDYTNWDGNKPEAAYTLIFSTGSQLDSGTIRATMEANALAKFDGVSAFLYPLSGINPDTLNPTRTKPKYKIPLGSKGTAEFPALARGAYRLFFVRDEFRNDVIDVGVDAFGTTTEELLLAEGATLEARLQLAPKVDALPPLVLDVRQVSPKRLLLRWSEKIEPVSLETLTEWRIQDSANMLASGAQNVQNLHIPQVHAFHTDPNNAAVMTLYLGKPLEITTFPAKTRWKLRTNAVRDSAQNPMPDSVRTVYFSTNPAPSQTDTASPLLIKTILANAPESKRFSPNAPMLQDSARGVPLQPQIGFVFSAALKYNVWEYGGKVIVGEGSAETYRRNLEQNIVFENVKQTPIPFRIVAATQANVMLLEPRTTLAPNEWYSVGLRTSAITAWNDAPCKDSVVIVRFQTSDPRDYGALSGTLTDSTFLPPSTTATMRFNASNDGILIKNITTTSAAIVLQTRASVSANIFINSSTNSSTNFSKNFQTKRSTNAQYVIVLESSQNQASLGNSSPNSSLNSAQNSTLNPSKNSPEAAPKQAQGITNLSAFAERRFTKTVRAVNGRAAWSFADIPPGTYTLTVFYDENGNGVYDFGSVFPYVSAERFHKHSTELQVRARWTMENIEVQMP